MKESSEIKTNEGNKSMAKLTGGGEGEGREGGGEGSEFCKFCRQPVSGTAKRLVCSTRPTHEAWDGTPSPPSLQANPARHGEREGVGGGLPTSLGIWPD